MYVIYHHPHSYIGEVRMKILGFEDFYSNNISYGRYDIVYLKHKDNTCSIKRSSIWVIANDRKEDDLFDMQLQGNDLSKIPIPEGIVSYNFMLTRILKIDDYRFLYEESNLGSDIFTRYNASKKSTDKLEQCHWVLDE